MLTARRRPRTAVDIWPGWVDALSTLLIIIIFVLLVFVLGQFFLGRVLVGREQTIGELNTTVAELGRMLSLEKQARSELETNVARLTEQLGAANAQVTTLSQLKVELDDKLASKTTEAENLATQLATASKEIEVTREDLDKKVGDIALLQSQVRALETLKEQLEQQAKDLGVKVARSDTAISEERRLSAEAKAQAALMAQEIEELRQELEKLSAALDASDKLTAEQKAQVSDLGRRMNRALAGKVQELQRYRSEFFGKLRDVLGSRPGVTVAGDRFIFQSEVLFASGSAELGIEGQRQLGQIAQTLTEVSRQIPADVGWVLRIDGHTDDNPIATALFPSNWELSTARALSVVRFLRAQGIAPDQLAAAGFGEFQPLDRSGTPAGRAKNRRIELRLDQR
ncbi:MAG: peptidoglycan -binding protein [Alphaproteobacteria bacterium]|nr:peptidoglycan -binding protein [Alphaproteobacteria bacterium]